MPEATATRLTISWSKDTDLALRSHLGSQGLKKGAISEFIENAVKWRLFHQTVSETRQAFASVPAAELDNLLNEAVQSVRQEKKRERKVRSRK
jgi:Ribbon-helix-helix domain